MATFNLVLLSSSPPTSSGTGRLHAATPPSNQQRVPMPALSPIDGSPFESTKTTSSDALKSGSRAAPVPEGVARGFATAGSLVKSHHFGFDIDEELADLRSAQLRRNDLPSSKDVEKQPRKPRKRAIKAAETGEAAEPMPKKPRARKPKADKDGLIHNAGTRPEASTTSSQFANSTAVADSIQPLAESAPPVPPTAKLTRSGKPRKPRAKKEKAEDGGNETIFKKAKVTKPKGAGRSNGKAQQKATGAVSEHFQTGDVGDGDAKGTESVQQKPDISYEVDETLRGVPTSPRRKATPPLKQPSPNGMHTELDLHDAVPRRRDWTPAKDTAPRSPFTDSSSKENNPLALETDNGSFTNMVSTFAFADNGITSAVNSKAASLEGAGVSRGRRVELMDMPANAVNSPNISPTKGKVPKKKPRTITDLVTGQYASKDTASEHPAVMGDFFGSCTTTTKVPLNDASTATSEKAPKKLTRSRSSSKSSEKKSSKSKKASAKAAAKPKMVADKLLSPASAMQKLKKQDILFGTSSQLALDESPTMVRQIQHAIRESELDAELSAGLLSNAGSRPRVWHRLEKTQGKQALWAASSRDKDGQLLERQEDVYIPEPDRTQDLPLLMDGTIDTPDEAFADNNDIFSSPTLPTRPSSDPTGASLPLLRSMSSFSVTADASKPATQTPFKDVYDDNPPPPSNQSAESSFLNIDDFITSKSFLPTISFMSTNNTRTAVSAGSPKQTYRGHPSKKSSSILESPPKYLPPNSNGRFTYIEEILDSEDDEALSPTPPRVRRLEDSEPLALVPAQPSFTSVNVGPSSPSRLERKGKAIAQSSLMGSEAQALSSFKPRVPALSSFTGPNSKPSSSSYPPPTAQPPTPEKKRLWSTTKAAAARKAGVLHCKQGPDLEYLAVHRISTSLLEWANIKPTIFAHITAHIHSLPPSTNPHKFTWHEKILMYDPIVLEDFTSYLNENTSIRAYKRATMKQVKDNAKARREGRAGPMEGRDLDLLDDIMAVHKELEIWMVKDWCQEMSVCCINKEKKPGTARKGFY